MSLSAVKVEDGNEYHSADYAYAPDKSAPDTWRLRLAEHGSGVTITRIGYAAAALSPGGFRGQKADIPKEDLPKVKATIREAYRKLGVRDNDMSQWVKEQLSRQLVHEFTPLSESVAEGFSRGIAEVTVIKPGFNSSRERYYPADMLRRDYPVFEGAKMFADHPTDSEDESKPERTVGHEWVGVLKNVRASQEGDVLGEAHIIEPWFQSKLAALRDANSLNTLGVSILAVGRTAPQKVEIEGIKTHVIESIVSRRSVDFVTEPGAGGHVMLYEGTSTEHDIDLIEVEQLRAQRPDLVDIIVQETTHTILKERSTMEELEKQIAELKEQLERATADKAELEQKIAEADSAQKKTVVDAKVSTALNESKLPDVAKERIRKQFKDAVSDDGLVEAIESERLYVASIAEAGKPRDMGHTQNDDSDKLFDARVATYIKEGHGKEQAERMARAFVR